MIGPRIGLRIGPKIGPAIGVGVDELGGAGMSSVSKDATSGIYLPANASQWSTTLSVAGITSGGPQNLWLMQDAAGNPADSIGSVALTATSASYQQAVSGWTTKGAGSTADGSAVQFATSDATMPDLSTTSQLVIAYMILNTAPAAVRDILSVGGATLATAIVGQMTTTPAIRVDPANAGFTTGVANVGTTLVRPYVIRHDKTNSRQTFCTDQEKLNPTFAAVSSGKGAYLLKWTNTAPKALCLYAVNFVGAAAELTDAQIRTLLVTLGWSPAW